MHSHHTLIRTREDKRPRNKILSQQRQDQTSAHRTVISKPICLDTSLKTQPITKQKSSLELNNPITIALRILKLRKHMSKTLKAVFMVMNNVFKEGMKTALKEIYKNTNNGTK